jgi:hypothetical protein
VEAEPTVLKGSTMSVLHQETDEFIIPLFHLFMLAMEGDASPIHYVNVTTSEAIKFDEAIV